MLDPFNKINDEDQKKLLRALEASIYTFPKNTSILPYLAGNDILGIVIEGMIQVVHIDHDGNQSMTEKLTENGVFGTAISSLYDNEHELITKEQTKIIVLDYFNLYNFSIDKPPYYLQFLLNLLEITKVIINQRNERIQILTQKTIRNRLLEYFRMISSQTRSRTIYLPFTFTELADYLAVDRSAMTREIKMLKEENIIEVKNKKITLRYSSYPARK